VNDPKIESGAVNFAGKLIKALHASDYTEGSFKIFHCRDAVTKAASTTKGMVDRSGKIIEITLSKALNK